MIIDAEAPSIDPKVTIEPVKRRKISNNGLKKCADRLLTSFYHTGITLGRLTPSLMRNSANEALACPHRMRSSNERWWWYSPYPC